MTYTLPPQFTITNRQVCAITRIEWARSVLLHVELG
jgi:hypothetical protein